MDHNILRCFVQVERMSEDQFIKRENDSEVEGKIVRGRPCVSRFLGVKEDVQSEVAELEGCKCELQL